MFTKIWKDPVWSKVIAAGILALIGSVAMYFSGAWPNLIKGISLACFFLLSSTSLPNWLLGIMFAPCILFIYVLLISIKEWFTGHDEPALSYKTYTKDNFFGLLWAWRYSGDEIVNLHSLCPRCKYQILPKDVSSYRAAPKYEYSCDDCGYSAGTFDGYQSDLHQKVELKIQKALRTGEWITNQNA